jgi:hypothetical protein
MRAICASARRSLPVSCVDCNSVHKWRSRSLTRTHANTRRCSVRRRWHRCVAHRLCKMPSVHVSNQVSVLESSGRWQSLAPADCSCFSPVAIQRALSAVTVQALLLLEYNKAQRFMLEAFEFVAASPPPPQQRSPSKKYSNMFVYLLTLSFVALTLASSHSEVSRSGFVISVF